MAEGELRKRILYDILLNAENAVTTAEDFDRVLQNIREEFVRLQNEGFSAFDVIQTKIKTTTLEPLQEDLRNLRAELRGLNADLALLKAAPKEQNLFTPGQQKRLGQLQLQGVSEADLQSEIAKVQQKVENLSNTTKLIPQALTRIKEGWEEVGGSVRSAEEITALLGQQQNAANQKILEMVQNGNSLENSIAGAAKSGEFLSGAANTAGNALKSTFSDTRKQLDGLGESFGQVGEFSDQFVAGVVSSKESMMGLVVEGKTLDEALNTVRNTGRYTAEQLDASFKLLQQDMAATAKIDPLVTARQGAQSFKVQVDNAKTAMQQLKSEGYSTAQILQGLKLAGFDTKVIQQAAKDMRILGDDTAKTSNILGRIFAAGAIGVALGAIRNLIQQLNEAAEAGYELSRSILEIAVQARALRREGGELLPSEWIETAKQLSKEFTQFSQRDINSAVSQLIRLGRQSDLTTSQIRKLITDALALATVKGMDAADAANAFATAVESGYARGLKEVVGAIDETTLAQEAIRRGLAETEDQVDANVRANTLLLISQEELNRVGDDISFIQNSLTGQYLTQQKAAETLKSEIGNGLLPAKILLYSIVLKLISGYNQLQEAAQQLGITIINYVAKPFIGAIAILSEFLYVIQGAGFSTKRFIDTFENLTDLFDQKLQNFLNPGLWDATADGIDNLGDAASGAADGVEELSDAMKDAFTDIRELFIDLYNSLEDISEDFRVKELEAQAKYAFDLLKLNEKLKFDIAKVWRNYYDDIAEANDDYRDKEIEAEEEYQEDLRKLRENFLFELEDALKARDARQIIRLIRQYNLRKEQLGREYNLEKDQRKREFKDQLEDIRRQRDIRLRELQIEAAQRRKMMAAEYQFEKGLRDAEHARRLAEEREQAKERFDELLRKLQDNGTLTEEEAKALSKIYAQYFNSDGIIAGSLEEFIAILQETADSAEKELLRIQNALLETQQVIAKEPLRRFQEGQYGEKFGYDPEEEKRRLQEGQYGTKFTFDKEGLEEEVRTQVPDEIDVPVNVNAVTGDVTLPEVSAIEEETKALVPDEIETPVDINAVAAYVDLENPSTVEEEIISSVPSEVEVPIEISTVIGDVSVPAITTDEISNQYEESLNLALQVGYDEGIEGFLNYIQSNPDVFAEINSIINTLLSQGINLEDMEFIPNFDIPLDSQQIAMEAATIANVIANEFGTGGSLDKVYSQAIESTNNFVLQDLPSSLKSGQGSIKTSANGIVKSLEALFGRKGRVERVFDYLVDLIQNAVGSVITAIQRLKNALMSISSIKMPSAPSTSGGGSSANKKSIPMAKGGTLLASSPTTVTFGEAGPELAQFTPLSKSSMPNIEGALGGTSGMDGLMQILVSLSPGLEAEIVNDALGQMAEVIIETNRKRL